MAFDPSGTIRYVFSRYRISILFVDIIFDMAFLKKETGMGFSCDVAAAQLGSEHSTLDLLLSRNTRALNLEDCPLDSPVVNSLWHLQ